MLACNVGTGMVDTVKMKELVRISNVSVANPHNILFRGSNPAISVTAVPAVSCAILTARAGGVRRSMVEKMQAAQQQFRSAGRATPLIGLNPRHRDRSGWCGTRLNWVHGCNAEALARHDGR